MGTPTNVLFSPIVDDDHMIISHLMDGFAKLDVEVETIGELGTDEIGDLEFKGEIEPYFSVQQLNEKFIQLRSVAIRTIDHVTNNRVYFYLWKKDQYVCMSIEIPSSIIFHHSEDYEQGIWFLKFLVSIASELKADACVYGPIYEGNPFASISVKEIVESFENGKIFQMSYPNLHLIKVDFISIEKMEKILSEHAQKQKFPLQHRLIASGYHLLSVL